MKILPWIKDYMLEREADWLTLPHGQGSWDLQVQNRHSTFWILLHRTEQSVGTRRGGGGHRMHEQGA